MGADAEREALIRALIPAKYQHLYTTNATFATNINYLASLLPVWIDGIAMQAERVDTELQYFKEHLMRDMPRMITESALDKLLIVSEEAKNRSLTPPHVTEVPEDLLERARQRRKRLETQDEAGDT